MTGIDSIGLLLFLLQQFAVALAVGASTFASMFYIVGLADGVIDPSERRFMRAVYTTLRVALFLLVMTGLVITAAHYLAGETAVLLQPTYLFKWALIGVLIVSATLMDVRVLSTNFGGALSGASWYALFVVHTLSLSFDWPVLVGVYVLWVAVFWLGFILLRRRAIALYVQEGTIPMPKLLKSPHGHAGASSTPVVAPQPATVQTPPTSP